MSQVVFGRKFEQKYDILKWDFFFLSAMVRSSKQQAI